ncbi:DUF624 domain-containing protein [Microbacterium protaetiae]|uniref:DUF624 domain-containing protein n=1 Tax=Microbacterium protaetiae TaxID=2509458 RepID=A0A4P6EDJ3_9MICO|nr:YesL family protein [Microbacterium protaetiae]QAY60204.1 DUF624 domain-containing protein [Microbacterium protaetiae]
MQIDPNGKTVQGLTTFLAFVALNVVYLVTCLPIVTIGAATSALYEVTIRYADDESGRPLKDYFPAFGRNFRRASLASLVLLVPVILMAYSVVFWWANPSVLGGIAAVVAALAAVYLFIAWMYAMALVAWFDAALKQTLKNALLLPGAESARTFGIILIPLALVVITLLFPPFGFIVLTVGFSVGAYATAFLFRSVFARHVA